MIKDMIKSIIRKSGFDIIRNNVDHIYHRDPLKDASNILDIPDPMCFDVGANIGQTVRRLQHIFPRPTIHAFEPSPSTFEKLSKSAADRDNVILNQLGLGATEGEIILNENAHSDMTSFLRMGDAWGSISKLTPTPVTTVDTYSISKNIDFIHILKIDTQGFDHQVLIGSNFMLSGKRIRFVICEIIFDNMYKEIHRIDETIKYMLDMDYRLFGVYDQHMRDNRLSWADFMFSSGD